MTHVPPRDFDFVVKKLREFFQSRGFVEAHPQNRLSILAACEDPGTIASFKYGPQQTVWPLPQTGQMWLEDMLLREPDLPGLFCVTTSYRDEPNIVEGRHDIIFPLFEFESKGNMDDLLQMEKDLLVHLGFDRPVKGSETKTEFAEQEYEQTAAHYGVEELTHEHETKMCEEFSPVFILKKFPMNTSPFWNMKRNPDGKTSQKIDVILHGQETFGTAERSCDVKEMESEFRTITDGQYAQTIFDKFGKERVEQELAEFLAHDFFPRFGGGIGVTRLIRAMKLHGLME